MPCSESFPRDLTPDISPNTLKYACRIRAPHVCSQQCILAGFDVTSLEYSKGTRRHRALEHAES